MEETKVILAEGNMSEVKIVEKALSNGTVAFPEHYDGAPELSYHKVVCSEEQADKIADYLLVNEAESVPASGVGTS